MSRTWEDMVPRTVREWEHAGLECLVLKMPDLPREVGDGTEGWHCGYVRLPEGCRLPRRRDDAPGAIQGAAWGGLTFSGVPSGQSEGRWYGFDMGHSFDYEPEPGIPFGRYLHTDEEAIAVTERLADAIAEYLEGES